MHAWLRNSFPRCDFWHRFLLSHDFPDLSLSSPNVIGTKLEVDVFNRLLPFPFACPAIRIKAWDLLACGSYL
jgi:hypothetical protein